MCEGGGGGGGGEHDWEVNCTEVGSVCSPTDLWCRSFQYDRPTAAHKTVQLFTILMWDEPTFLGHCPL